MDTSGQPTLLFMPDISGFTQFVSATEINHSQHIIAELLETLIDNNTLGLSISEIEGDAIFFYKTDKLPSAEEIAEQCRKMFIAFRHQLSKYDLLRICDCGACSTANMLTLKFVAHVGNVSIMNVSNRQKLFGTDVILIHRLLKNEIPEHEYMLFTDQIPVATISNTAADRNWMRFIEKTESYDVGMVKYAYSHLASLYDQVPEPEIPKMKTFRVPNPVRYSIDVNAPFQFVYSILTELKLRAEALPGVEGIKVHDEPHNQINKLGTVHECIRNPPSGPALTSGTEKSDTKLMFTETSLVKPMSFDYIVEKTGGQSCRITLAVHMPLSLPKKILFNLMMKKQVDQDMTAAMAHVKNYLEKKYSEESRAAKVTAGASAT